MIKKWILVTLTAFSMLYGCASFDIGFLVQPAQPPSQKKPEASSPPQKVEPIETSPVKEITEKPAGSETPQEKPEETVPPEMQPVEPPQAQEQTAEPAPAQNQPEETPPEKEVAKVIPPEEKAKEKLEELPGEGKPSAEVKADQEGTSPETTDEKIISTKKGHEIVVIAGVVTVEKNEYFIFDPSSKIRYRLVGLKKEERDALQKQIGKMVKVEVKVLETQSARAYNTQLVRFL